MSAVTLGFVLLLSLTVASSILADRLRRLTVSEARTSIMGWPLSNLPAWSRSSTGRSVMSYAMALDAGRPSVSGILSFSGFVPEVEGWQPHFEDRRETRAFLAHGRSDPMIGVDFAHRARRQLEAGGLEVEYRESDIGHRIDPAHLRAASEWLDSTLPS